ncbi:MAG: chorismate synthase [Chlamydiae bacterium]|nr:chorismate synthase [Chlamydiota bacterium]
MGHNSFGRIFRITSWGESHGKAIGVVIDGCPAGLSLSEEDIQKELAMRAPGNSPFTSPRKEADRAEILSGVFEGKTTGMPISIIIQNQDGRSSDYEKHKDLLRPGHANYSYLEKYGIFDYRGGGRASGRETACRVAAGAVAKQLLAHFHIQLLAFIKEIGKISCKQMNLKNLEEIEKKRNKSSIFCPDTATEKAIVAKLKKIQEEKDSLGGVIELITSPLPLGLGDPIFEKLEANLAKALLSIPAAKGIEIGSSSAKMKGSDHNDLFILDEKNQIKTKTNHAGGILGGISNGAPLHLKVSFKPPSSIKKPQKTVSIKKEEATLEFSQESRHDPCVAIRAVPVVEAMTALVLADALLINRCSRLSL